MMRRVISLGFLVMATVMSWTVNSVWAHFDTITPWDDIVTQDDSRTLNLRIKFIHPMEMVKPKRFEVLHDGKKSDLLGALQAAKGKSMDQAHSFTYWTADYNIRRPGDYTFYVEPAPYWEPAEDLFMVDYTKVCVNAFGLEQGWDQPVGLETEIVPLTRPYGLWTGNLFTGQVLLKGNGPLCRGGDRVSERITR